MPGLSKGRGGLLRRFSRPVILLAVFFFAISGCSGKDITISYDPAAGVPEAYGIKTPLKIAIAPYSDKRTGISSKRKVADILTTVADVYSTELLLNEDVSAFVTTALKEQLNHVGFRAEILPGVSFDKPVSKNSFSSVPADADIVFAGEINRFHLTVGNRDKIEIELATSVYDRKTARLIWSGTTIEQGDRFAGSFGNTKKSITRYISRSMSLAAKKLLKESEPALARFVAAPASAPAPEDLTIPARPSRQETRPVIRKESEGLSTGTLMVTSNPAGAKLYINGVYYGRTPFTMELKPDIYEVTAKLKGFRDEKERVAIRPGSSTELNVLFGD